MKNNRCIFLTVLGAFLAGSIAWIGSALAESSITATLIRGKASILRSNSTTWTPLGGELPADFKPTQITARGTFKPTPPPTPLQNIRYTFTFWDAGAKLGNSKYANVDVVQEYVSIATGKVEESYKTTCTFSGGPTGQFFKSPADNSELGHVEYAGITGQLNGATGNIMFTWNMGGTVTGYPITVTVDPLNAFDDFPPDVPTALGINDKIKTEDNTRVELKFPDGSVFRIKSGTILTLMTGGIQLQVGDAWFNLQKQGTTFQIVTPTANFGVLGTEFSISVDNSGNSAVLLYKGTVQVSDPNGKNTVTLNAGQKITADAKGLSKPATLSAGEKEDAWEASYANMDSTGGGGCSVAGVTLD